MEMAFRTEQRVRIIVDDHILGVPVRQGSTVQLSLVRFVIAAQVEREGELEGRGDQRIICKVLPR